MKRLALGLFVVIAGCGDTGSNGGDAGGGDMAMAPSPDLAKPGSKDMAMPSGVDLCCFPTDFAMPNSGDLSQEIDDLTGVPIELSVLGDMAEPDDLTAPDDLATTPDLATLPDLTFFPDLTAPTCVDGVKNQDETDIDCGGLICPKCADTKMCLVVGDCVDGVCANGMCSAPTCHDLVKNGLETGVDCGGGVCPKCGDGLACVGPADCVDGICTMNLCAAPTCMDMVKNGLETDVDCGGGVCGKCVDGKACVVAGDCVGGACNNNKCLTPSCMDGIKNGSETDIDCGGPKCAPCANGKACGVKGDCASGVCTAMVCVAPSCMDGIKNGAETDIDCGGPMCGKCAITKNCLLGTDCASSFCQDGGTCQFAQSCVALILGNNAIGSGTYTIDPDGNGPIAPFPVLCDMVSDGGGWALAAKIDGTLQTWIYAKPVWGDATTFGPNDVTLTEAKTGAFNSMPFTKTRIVVLDGGVDRSAIVAPANLAAGSTLSAVFKSGTYHATALTRPGWLAELASGSLQTNCGQEGFNNTVAGPQNMRLGIFGNQENDCGSCDSFFGFGYDSQAAANDAVAQWDNSGAGGRSTQVFGFLWIR